MKWKPSQSQRERYSIACRKAESMGFKIHKTTNGLSLYGVWDGKYTRISNHFLPDQYIRDFEDEILCNSQWQVFKTIGIDL